MPLVGALDSSRMQLVIERALQSPSGTRTTHLIIDITAVPVVDTMVAHGIIQVVQAARLLGATTLLVGIRPEVAQTIVRLGLRLDDIVTMSTLQEGIAYARREVVGARPR
jgi:rsbT co-antagonist protein RsbR